MHWHTIHTHRSRQPASQTASQPNSQRLGEQRNWARKQINTSSRGMGGKITIINSNQHRFINIFFWTTCLSLVFLFLFLLFTGGNYLIFKAPSVCFVASKAWIRGISNPILKKKNISRLLIVWLFKCRGPKFMPHNYPLSVIHWRLSSVFSPLTQILGQSHWLDPDASEPVWGEGEL